jgi:hypothetical protein
MPCELLREGVAVAREGRWLALGVVYSRCSHTYACSTISGLMGD